MGDTAAALRDRADALIAGHADAWDRAGAIPVAVLRELGAAGVLCAQVPTGLGGPGLSSRENGELTAYVGGRDSSVRSVMTSQGMAAWAVQRLGDAGQRTRFLAEMCGGRLAAVAFSEVDAGSDLTAMRTALRREGEEVVLDGAKVWCTGAATADLLLVFGRYEDGAAAVLVPADSPGVRLDPIRDAHGCRAAGHADIRLDGVRVPAGHLLGGVAQSLPLLVTTALAYGRMSVAWGCAGILTACSQAAGQHAVTRRQSGRPLADHQLVTRHLADLFIAEQTARRACEHASACWDDGRVEVVIATVLAKHVSATNAAAGAATALQVLASAGARDGLVARAHRDTKLMEIIEGTNEICELILGRHAAEVAPAPATR
jgi:alkylation response protein AidB-like acyl-CoA dehydrogenase